MIKLNILGYEITTSTAEELAKTLLNSNYKKPVIVNTLNPHSYVVAKSDELFKSSLENSDFLLPDGIGIVIAAKFLKRESISKASGPDFFKAIMCQLNKKKGSVFFLGSTLNTLSLIEGRISDEYHNVSVSSFSPPFQREFSDDDIGIFVAAINKFAPDVVFVGLTAPKQEKLISRMDGMLNVKVISGVGAAFDYFAGTIEEPVGIWQKLGLEWFRRLISEPRRLWRRTFISAPIFLFDLVKFRLFNKI